MSVNEEKKAQIEVKYEDIDLEHGLQYYDGEEDMVIKKMQAGATAAIAVLASLEKRSMEYWHVHIFIDQDNLKMVFSMAKWNEDADQYDPSETFFEFFVGEPMAEALVILKKRDRSGNSMRGCQAIHHWLEEIDFEAFGELEDDYSFSDAWGWITD